MIGARKIGLTSCTESCWHESIRSAYVAADFGNGGGFAGAAGEGICLDGYGAGGDNDGGEDQRRGRGRDPRLQGRTLWRGHGEDAVHGSGGAGAVDRREGMHGVYDDGSAVGGGANGRPETRPGGESADVVERRAGSAAGPGCAERGLPAPECVYAGTERWEEAAGAVLL